jgi:glycosyltransferase involved in cell wall biosynthesis
VIDQSSLRPSIPPSERPISRLRIAQVSPLYESVPPAMYGGTERVVYHLTEALLRLGHEVTLFASGDSRIPPPPTPPARLIPCCRRALRLASCSDATPCHTLMIERVFDLADQFDLVHFHTEPYHFPLLRRAPVPSITTAHGRLDLPDTIALLEEFAEIPLVSISDRQRHPVPHANFVATVYHGLPPEDFPFQARPCPHPYLAFVGRMSPEKRPDLAIQIAQEAGMELRIAAKVSDVDRPYFDQQIRPLLARPHVRFLGELGHADKSSLMAGATALLMPIDWPEPFGLVMIESMACGTPVVAFRRGSVPEIVDHGRTGFIVDSVPEAARAVHIARGLDRRAIRGWFEARFSARRMAEDYLRVYRRQAAAFHAGLAPPAGRHTPGGAAGPGAQHGRHPRD